MMNYNELNIIQQQFDPNLGENSKQANLTGKNLTSNFNTKSRLSFQKGA